uniref:F-box domain-containing protein n=1 Tax=Marseillevirus LCMAC102 TaxID=2506603 RepID=A0A481YSW1_9VIRU|nr:MAG: hypothetical protein LCMAC102_01680 [Marseillevirus LCMAC102]
MTTLSTLPNDNISTILSFLHQKAVIALGLTSKHFFARTKNQREKDNKCRGAWKIIVWWRSRGIDMRNCDFDGDDMTIHKNDVCLAVWNELIRNCSTVRAEHALIGRTHLLLPVLAEHY